MEPNKCNSSAILAAAVIMALPVAALCAEAISDLHITYKMDPRLASGVYGGERWVSPPTYTTTLQTVEARIEGITRPGNSVPVKAEWTAEDPEMLSIAPAENGQVKITVRRNGQSRLTVIAEGVSKTLVIKASPENNSTKIEISAAEPAATLARGGTAGSDTATGALKSRKEQVSYALGANLGNGLRREAVDVNTEAIIQGLKDALSGNALLLSAHEISVVIAGLKSDLTSKRIVSAAEKINATKQLADKNKREGDQFLAENKSKQGVVTLESGVQYKILGEGSGARPEAGDAILCNYRGTLVDGTEFDSSYSRKKPAIFPLDNVIKGWQEALQLMPVGSKWQLVVPPGLAYGEKGSSSAGVPPNATLIFEVELLSAKPVGGTAAANARPAVNTR
jgi:FKBP-type peptidyl-prolyl cis-trans isomerase FklB